MSDMFFFFFSLSGFGQILGLKPGWSGLRQQRQVVGCAFMWAIPEVHGDFFSFLAAMSWLCGSHTAPLCVWCEFWVVVFFVEKVAWGREEGCSAVLQGADLEGSWARTGRGEDASPPGASPGCVARSGLGVRQPPDRFSRSAEHRQEVVGVCTADPLRRICHLVGLICSLPEQHKQRCERPGWLRKQLSRVKRKVRPAPQGGFSKLLLSALTL